MIHLRRRAMVRLMMPGGKHPHILLTDKFKVAGIGSAVVIVVPLSTSRGKYYDPTCEFKESPDKLIRAGSHVIYSGADAGGGGGDKGNEQV